MTFNFDIILLIVAIFMFLSGLYFGFYNQLRRTLSNVAGLFASIFLTPIVLNALGAMDAIKEIIVKIVNVFFAIDEEVAINLAIGLVIFLTVKIVVYIFVGFFKKRGVQAFVKDKSAISHLIGGVLGIVNAYVASLILFIIFACCGAANNANVSLKLFTILPQLRELIEPLMTSQIID